mgnify:CR=1 FL=1
MNTFTKTLASTVRISYMILPRPLLEQFYQKIIILLPVRYQTLNNIPWICLSKKDISKNILTGCAITIKIEKWILICDMG